MDDLETYQGEVLDILHTIDLDKLYPIIRCQVDFKKPIDIERLKKAVATAGQLIPEIFGSYDMKNNSFIVKEKNPSDIIFYKKQKVSDEEPSIDLINGAQLKIVINNDNGKQQLVFLMSHILMDGAGFKCFLYLLADCYNYGEKALKDIKLDRSITEVKKLLNSFKSSNKVSDHPTEPLFLPELAQGEDRKYRVADLRFSKKETKELINKAHNLDLTLNDIFMAAFGQVVQDYCGVKDYSMACPTDIRRSIQDEENGVFHLVNMTARYNLALTDTKDIPLKEFATRVHEQMKEFKLSHQFLQSIQDLIKQSVYKQLDELQEIVQENYHVRPIAYTNFGVIDADRIRFKGAEIERFILTGSFRKAPMFQVAVATFADQIDLAFNMIGTTAEYRIGKVILKQIKNSILLL